MCPVMIVFASWWFRPLRRRVAAAPPPPRPLLCWWRQFASPAAPPPPATPEPALLLPLLTVSRGDASSQQLLACAALRVCIFLVASVAFHFLFGCGAARRCSTRASAYIHVKAAAALAAKVWGWLEGGLVSSFEKFVMDADQLGALHHIARGVEMDENAQAMGAIREVGPGGH